MKLRRIVSGRAGSRASWAELARRTPTAAPEVEATVAAIVADVAERGDEAVRDYTERYDQRSPVDGSYELSRQRWDELADSVPAGLSAALGRAAERIRAFHRPQAELPGEYELAGGVLGLRVVPLSRAGLYVPGGTALYPSSVLMTAIPARLAGVGELIMVTPGASPETLAAAREAGVDRVFEIGGAQAVAALAYGTATVPQVDKIVGPGNQWVAAAKRQVFGVVDIDSIAGPSEVLVIADSSANAAWLAADLLAQAEHDVEARAILVTDDPALVDRVDAELTSQLEQLPRREIAEAALKSYGTALVVQNMDEAIEVAEAYGPEHLELLVAEPSRFEQKLTRAGAVFVGPYSPEALGDYVAGPNHVLPTGGAARYASPLGVYDFRKHISIMRFDRARFEEIALDAEALAHAEGLTAHARSVEMRRKGTGE